MHRDTQTLLRHILEAANDIERYVLGLDFDLYLSADIVRAATERKFEIIGEATKLLSEVALGLAARITQRANLIAFRNILIHGYSRIDDKRVYLATQAPLAELRREVAALLAELDRS